MTVSNFIKENRVLVAGIVLPLLLIILMVFAKTIPASMIDPPKHKVMYLSKNWSQKGNISIKVETDGTINPVFTPNKDYKENANDNNPTTILYLYDPQTNTSDETSITLDANGNVTALEKFKDIKLSTQAISKDGYMFEPYSYSHGSLITDIFSYRSSYNGPSISNKARVINLPQGRLSYGQFDFVGWSIDTVEGATK